METKQNSTVNNNLNEVIERMVAIKGLQHTINFCNMTIFTYNMKIDIKYNSKDLSDLSFYVEKLKNLQDRRQKEIELINDAKREQRELQEYEAYKNYKEIKDNWTSVEGQYLLSERVNNDMNIKAFETIEEGNKMLEELNKRGIKAHLSSEYPYLVMKDDTFNEVLDELENENVEIRSMIDKSSFYNLFEKKNGFLQLKPINVRMAIVLLSIAPTEGFVKTIDGYTLRDLSELALMDFNNVSKELIKLRNEDVIIYSNQHIEIINLDNLTQIALR